MTRIKKNALSVVPEPPLRMPSSLVEAISADSSSSIESEGERFIVSRKIAQGVSSAGSIDSYIERNTGEPYFADLAKLHIAYVIADAEANTIIAPLKASGGRYAIDEDKWDELRSTRAFSFVQALFERLRNSDTNRIGRGLTIISFNYDRTLEFFLLTEIQRSFHKLTPSDAYKCLQNIEIIHPYGTLGGLPQFGVEMSGTPFAPSLGYINLHKMRRSLVTWSERRDVNEKEVRIKQALADAKQVVFLGFAFAPQNMELLRIQPQMKRDRPIRIISTDIGGRPRWIRKIGSASQAYGAMILCSKRKGTS